MGIFSRITSVADGGSEQGATPDAGPALSTCALCGEVLPRDSGFKLSDGQFVCAKCLLEKGIGNFPSASGWDLGTLRSYIDGRGELVASYEPSKVVAGGRLKVDVGHELFCINNNILPYDSLLDCELVDKCWPAEVGGALRCHELLVMVTLRRAHVDVLRIPFIGADASDAGLVAVSSVAYRNARDDAYACLAVLEQIDRANRMRELQDAVAAAVGEAGAGTSGADENVSTLDPTVPAFLAVD